MSIAFISLGGNLGNPVQSLTRAVEYILALDGVRGGRLSSFYRTEPVDSDGPDYVNAVLEIETEVNPESLLRMLLTIESNMGRIRPEGVVNAPRNVDIDLLLVGEHVINNSLLTLPHPRMHERAFVLVPLLEIAPEVEIPTKGKAMDFLENVKHQRIEKIYDKCIS